MRKVIRMGLLLTLLIAAVMAIEAQAASTRINVLHAKGTINPVLVDYIKRGIEQSEADNAVACIIQLDTPGGLDTAMRDIAQKILNAKVPVVVYVSPSGARAASAGAFITLAAHVAAMAPNTTIGAAHPVAIGPEGETKLSENMTAKIVNDAAAYIRSLAESKKRNAEWAEKAVRESVSATEQEALQLNIIDIVAPDLDALITDLDGKKVTMLDGSAVTLKTRGITVNHIGMNLAEDFLYTIANPNIAFLLLSLALLGLMVEISHPGLIFPGVVGAICLLLAFYSLGMLPVNYAGVLLIILAFGLFIAEIFTTSFGILATGGVVALIIGSLILFKGGTPLFQVDPWLIATVIILLTGSVAFIAYRAVAAHRRQATTGREELIGKTATVRTPLEPEGTVFYQGELWIAVSETGRVKPGEEVIITKVDGLKLSVKRKI